jgi:Flp pilus assembly pilin Flp
LELTLIWPSLTLCQNQTNLSRQFAEQKISGVAILIVLAAEGSMTELIRRLWSDERGQDIAEYAVMLAVILVLVVGTIRLIGSSANNAFSAASSAISQ